MRRWITVAGIRRGAGSTQKIGEAFSDDTTVLSRTWAEFNRGNSRKHFVDRARIRVHGGRGGAGCISFHLTGPSTRRPSGGHGGGGGNVVIVADPQKGTLQFQQHHFRAKSGTNGGSSNKTGHRGEELVIHVPCGTVVRRVVRKLELEDDMEEAQVAAAEAKAARKQHNRRQVRRRAPTLESSSSNADDEFDEEGCDEEIDDADEDEDDEWDNDFEDDDEGDEEWTEEDGEQEEGCDEDEDSDDEEEEDYDDEEDEEGYSDEDMYDEDEEEEFEMVELGDLETPGQQLLAAKGGRQGLGNAMLAHSKNRSSTLHHRGKGDEGEEVFLELELKTIAEIGLVGYPNAGKSSFLAAASNAKPHVAPYPFTTLRPNVGTIEYSDFKKIVVADLPGLVTGAHENRGLGHSFLRHVERVSGLLFVVDAAGVDGRCPSADLTQLLEELDLYEPGLASRPAVVIANKVDLPASQQHLPKLRALVKNLMATEGKSSNELEGVRGSGIRGLFECSMATKQGLGEAVVALRSEVLAQERPRSDHQK